MFACRWIHMKIHWCSWKTFDIHGYPYISSIETTMDICGFPSKSVRSINLLARPDWHGIAPHSLTAANPAVANPVGHEQYFTRTAAHIFGSEANGPMNGAERLALALTMIELGDDVINFGKNTRLLCQANLWKQEAVQSSDEQSHGKFWVHMPRRYECILLRQKYREVQQVVSAAAAGK